MPSESNTPAGPRVLVAVTIATTAVVLLRRQLGWLRSRGFDITVVSAPDPELAALAAREGVACAEVPMVRNISPRADIASLCRFVELLRRERPDITHVSTPKAGLVGGLAALITRVPNRIYTLRGLRLETARGVSRATLWLAELIACRSAHVVVAVSPSLARRAVELRLVSRSNVVVIGRGSSNGVDVARFTPTPQRRDAATRFRASLGISPRAPVVGFVGRLTPDKGLHELLTAVARVRRELPETRLLLVGEIEGGEAVLSGLASADIGASIVTAGWLDDPAVAYLAMDVLALPTYREGFPNVPLEAAASGRPVVTTTATGAVDSVKDGVTGLLVPPRDSAALTAALLRLLRDPAECRRFGEAGRAWVREDFDPQTAWQGVADIYSRLLTRPDRRRSP